MLEDAHDVGFCRRCQVGWQLAPPVPDAKSLRPHTEEQLYHFYFIEHRTEAHDGVVKRRATVGISGIEAIRIQIPQELHHRRATISDGVKHRRPSQFRVVDIKDFSMCLQQKPDELQIRWDRNKEMTSRTS